ncbi:MAG: murein L,D-transpeptidase catalytic domain family protein [Chitinophagaceae bacterium]|nr:MAG: murein L,D-transpeptidase catalytic domain family protein [Chitinophagaceae bacterium]
MKKIFLPTSFVCLLTIFFALTSFKARSNKAANNTAATSAITANTSVEDKLNVEAVSNMIYDSLQLDNFGLSREVMQFAYKGQQELINRGLLNNEDIIAICDFSQSSSKKRLYIIDTRNYRVLYNTYVAHGKNSGLNYAEHFSNTPESLQSSLGFYRTKGTYFGKHGLSLKLEGLERGFNDNAEARAVVMHGADYIGDSRAGSAYMGRSFGCPAVPQAQSEKIINMLKNGSALFIYHPTQKYLNASTILND